MTRAHPAVPLPPPCPPMRLYGVLVSAVHVTCFWPVGAGRVSVGVVRTPPSSLGAPTVTPLVRFESPDAVSMTMAMHGQHMKTPPHTASVRESSYDCTQLQQ